MAHFLKKLLKVYMVCLGLDPGRSADKSTELWWHPKHFIAFKVLTDSRVELTKANLFI